MGEDAPDPEPVVDDRAAEHAPDDQGGEADVAEGPGHRPEDALVDAAVEAVDQVALEPIRPGPEVQRPEELLVDLQVSGPAEEVDEDQAGEGGEGHGRRLPVGAGDRGGGEIGARLGVDPRRHLGDVGSPQRGQEVEHRAAAQRAAAGGLAARRVFSASK